jgi:hypothetical protein
VTGDGNCVFRECKGFALAISEDGSSGVIGMTICTRDDVKNTEEHPGDSIFRKAILRLDLKKRKVSGTSLYYLFALGNGGS